MTLKAKIAEFVPQPRPTGAVEDACTAYDSRSRPTTPTASSPIVGEILSSLPHPADRITAVDSV